MLPLLVSKWTFMGASGEFAASLEIARQIEQLVSEGNDVEALVAHRCSGTGYLFAGELNKAAEELKAFFALYEPEQHDPGLGRFGSSHHGTMSAVGLAELAVLACDEPEATFWTAKANALADRSGQAHDLCHCTFFTGCVLPLLRGELDKVRDMARQLRDIAKQHNLPIWEIYSDLFDGIVLMHQGSCISAWCSMQRPVFRSVWSNKPAIASARSAK